MSHPHAEYRIWLQAEHAVRAAQNRLVEAVRAPGASPATEALRDLAAAREHASHSLRTLLATVRAECEVIRKDVKEAGPPHV
jgi:hypothetical protein